MEATWTRANVPIVDREHRQGTVSAFFDYDLLRWTFGVRAENDDSWFEVEIVVGPISLSIIYWRQWS